MSHLFSAPERRDIVASIGVFTVAVPLSLGIALASGVPASSAIIAAIIGGIVIGVLSGAPLVVSGPAAGLSAMVLQFVQQYGLRGLAIITILAGLLQVSLGVARLGRLFTLVPKPVLEGMLAAIGTIIVAGQMHVLLGGTVPGSFGASAAGLPAALGAAVASPELRIVAALGVFAIALQLVWPRLGKKLNWMPGALPAVGLVTLIGIGFTLPRVALGSLHGEALDALSGWLSAPPTLGTLGVFALPAIALALVASAETLLTARAVDSLAESRGLPSKARLDRELIAQGFGNALAGVVGGMPVTGVIVRSAANINFGAATRWSTILHGLWVALAAGAFPFIVNAIPLTALAAVLVITGFRLLNPGHVWKLFRESTADGVVWVATFGAILATDLLSGLGVGLAAAVVLNLKQVVAAVRAPRRAEAGDDATRQELVH